MLVAKARYCFFRNARRLSWWASRRAMHSEMLSSACDTRRGAPVIFRSMDETVEYARMHDVQRWMVFGDPEGWWPLYTQDGPVNPPPPAKERVDISLH